MNSLVTDRVLLQRSLEQLRTELEEERRRREEAEVHIIIVIIIIVIIIIIIVIIIILIVILLPFIVICAQDHADPAPGAGRHAAGGGEGGEGEV